MRELKDEAGLRSRLEQARRGGIKGTRTRMLKLSTPRRNLLPLLECQKRWAAQEQAKIEVVDRGGRDAA
jgi:hypothetical protein